MRISILLNLCKMDLLLRIWCILVNARRHLNRLSILLFWVKCSINVNYILFIDGTVEFFYNLTDFLFHLSIVEKGILKSPTIIVELCIFFFKL